jgi:primosomal protein N' (replication factor Y)
MDQGGLFGELDRPPDGRRGRGRTEKKPREASSKAAPSKSVRSKSVQSKAVQSKAVQPRVAAAPPPAPGTPTVQVALDRAVRTEFSYLVAPEWADRAVPGVRVRVPFGSREAIGVVVAQGQVGTGDAPERWRSLRAVLDAEPLVDPPLLELTRWMAREYACAWGEALGAILPAPLKHERGERQVLWVRTTAAATPEALAALEGEAPEQHRLLRTLAAVEGEILLRELVGKLGLSDSPARTLARKGLIELRRGACEPLELGGEREPRRRPERLTEEQQWATVAIGRAVERREPRSFLLQGVTGSGKTEVYLTVIERALALGRGAIVLVPEIALTPQTVGWFRSRFGDVAVLHSRLTDAQRLAAWRRVRRGEARVVVGARSAIFAPLRDLGVVVVDEEHEPSFKQGSTPRYHAREVALERCRREGAVCVLGSATPALETFAAAARGEHAHLHLRQRVGARPLPRVDVIDLRTEPAAGAVGLFSRPLRQLLEQTLQRGEQGILFLNRRGYAPVLWCPGCRTVVRCGQCDTPLTWHRHIDRLVCHLCQHEQPVPKNCPTCSAPGGRMLGAGSEQVEAVLRGLLPRARIARMDSDTMHRREDYERTLSAFGAGELDFLVGTQMIAKGLDFPRVTLVGIVSADTSLHLPDFRSAERTFQLIAQVAGRAGRAELEGRIVVQTENPEHAAVRCAARHEYEAFAAVELGHRRELGYPPFGRLVRALFEDDEGPRAAQGADAVAQLLTRELAGSDAVVLGPAPAPLALVRGRYRHHLLVKLPLGSPTLDRVRELLLEAGQRNARPRLAIDVDPMAML